MAKSSYMPPWDYEFREGLPCLHCGNSETVVLCAPGATSGICEPCSAHVHWVWRLLPGEAPPVALSERPQRVKVLAGMLCDPSGELPVVAEVAESYQFAMVPAGEAWDLPTADVGEGEGAELDAVRAALASAGLASWPALIEPLYTGYAPRGSLVRVYLARAWYPILPGKEPQFRAWPVSQHSGGASGFYLALGQVFPLRLWKHMAMESRPNAVTFRMRKGSVEYVAVQDAVRRGEKNVDTSIMELLYKRMTADERLVAQHLAEVAGREAELAAETSEAEAEEKASTTVQAGAEEESLEEAFEDALEDKVDSVDGE